MLERRIVDALVCAALISVAIVWIVSLAKSPSKVDAADGKSFAGAPPIGVTVCKPGAPAKSFRVSSLEQGQHAENTSSFIVTCADGTKQIVSVQQRVLLNVNAAGVQK